MVVVWMGEYPSSVTNVEENVTISTRVVDFMIILRALHADLEVQITYVLILPWKNETFCVYKVSLETWLIIEVCEVRVLWLRW